MPSIFRQLVLHPPQGYRYVNRELSRERVLALLARTDFAYTCLDWARGLMPLDLVKSYFSRRTPAGTDLTYALTHVVLRPEPWVLEMGGDYPEILVGSRWWVDRCKKALNRLLLSDYCRKIIFQFEANRRAFLARMDCPQLESKMEVVYLSVPGRDFTKGYQSDRIKLLFVNSANLNHSRHFHSKGGKEVVAAFLQLSRRYPNLELVIRSGMAPEDRNKYRRLDNVRIMDKPVPWAELEREWQSADIFVMPTHITPAVVFLDAMSYELPVVTTDVWGNPEIVSDGKTGFLVPKSGIAGYIKDGCIDFGSPEYKKVVETVDPRMVAALVEKTGTLIENESLRRRMGRAGRREIEHGKFSIETRNERLKGVFDAAIA